MTEITRAQALALIHQHWTPGTIPPGRFWLFESREEAESMDYDELFVFQSAEDSDCVVVCHYQGALVQLALFNEGEVV